MIIGITGASGSGKTSFLNALCEEFESEEICLISQDNYYKPAQEQSRDQAGVQNFDLPTALRMEEYVRDIRALQAGQTVSIKEYTFNNPNKTPKLIELVPAPLILVEGLFIFHSAEMRQLFDLKVFVDVEDHIRLKRRILRDNSERGYPLDDVLYRYEHHVFPAYQQYIAPYKYQSDVIIPNNHNFRKGLEVLVAFLKGKLYN